jgi:hypothetical protein
VDALAKATTLRAVRAQIGSRKNSVRAKTRFAQKLGSRKNSVRAKTKPAGH